MRCRITFAIVSFAALVAACGPKPRIPFDASHVPAGRGWYCYEHSRRLAAHDLGGCRRNEAECYVDKEKRGRREDRCIAADRAFCIVVARTNDPESDVPDCYPRRESCDPVVEDQSRFFSVSECAEMP